MADGLRLALTTLTVARVRGPLDPDRRTAGRAMALAPLVGLALGLVAAGVYELALAAGPAGAFVLPSALAVATLALATRGLHLDGVADLTDGLASYRDPAGARAVMKSPEVGPLGVAAVVLVVLVQTAAIVSCAESGRGVLAIVLAPAVGRLAIVAACRRTPAAVDQGMGALVAGTVRRGVTAGWALVLAGAGAAYWLLVGADLSRAGTRIPYAAAVYPPAAPHPVQGTEIVNGLTAVALPGAAAGSAPSSLQQAALPFAAVALALLVALLLRRHAVRRTGGLTGDLLGALCEVATISCLLVLTVSF